MYRSLLCCLFVFLYAALQGQKAEGGRPYSDLIVGLKSSATPVPQINLKTLDVKRLLEEEQEDPVPARYGVFTDTVILIKTTGKMDIIPSKGRIWRLRISTSNARCMQLFFKKFILPAGATLFLYDDRQLFLYGAFTKNNFQPDSSLMIADFRGNHVIAEYFEPDNPEFEGEVVIGAVGQSYKDALTTEAGPGFINVNCPIGKDAQLAKHAVLRMSFRSGSFQVTCSGALINNAKNDGTPYILTANHCLSTFNEATTLNVYFNYEVEGCNGDTLIPLVLSGSKLLTTGQPSDYTLLKLNETPTKSYQPYYAGWDVNDLATDTVTGIHVPFGNTKKISIDYDTIISNPFSVTWDDDSRSPIGSHWIIGYDDGGTSQGSSGSPVFNSMNRIIGQLHGGDDQQAYYGKLSYSYSHKPASYLSIGHYLDPDSTGIKVLDGYSPVDNIPDAFFITRFEQVCHNTPITFEDFSVFGPYKRSWSVSPVGFGFLNGTSDTSSHPVIEFLNDTVYTIKLDLFVDDEVESTEFMKITAGTEITIQVKSDSPVDLCDCDFEDIHLTSNGADNYTWSILPGDENKIILSNPGYDTTTVSRITDFKADSGYVIGLIVVGTQSTCRDTIQVNYNVLKPANDEIENAILLDYGMSEYYSNICGSVEENEPIPPFTSCTSQNSWCDEYGTGEDIVENSVWFKFIASTTGKVSISSTGFDNQIALYAADSYTDILNGDYFILGANDDRTESDFRPLIVSETVIPGATYWIQVDGSGGGLEDEFYLTINELAATPTFNVISEGMSVYPQPSFDRVYLRNAGWTEHRADVMVYTTSGICLLSEIMHVDDRSITLDVAKWEPGVYIATIRTGGLRYMARIVKK